LNQSGGLATSPRARVASAGRIGGRTSKSGLVQLGAAETDIDA